MTCKLRLDKITMTNVSDIMGNCNYRKHQQHRNKALLDNIYLNVLRKLGIKTAV